MEKEKQLQENINERTEEFEIIRQAVLRKTQAEDTKRQMHSLVLNAFKQFSSIKLVNIPPEITNIFVLGFRFSTSTFASVRIVASFTGENVDGVYWASSSSIVRYLKCIADNQYCCTTKSTYYFPSLHSSPQFTLEGIKTFYIDEGKQISYRPTKPKDDSWVCSLQSVVENIDEPIPTKSSYLLKVDPPAPKNTIQSSKMKEGEYVCYQYASTTYRGKPKTILFLIGTAEEEIPTYGPFLQQKVEKLDLSNCIAPIYCRIGEFKHTKSRHKDRTFSIVASHPMQSQLMQSQAPVQIQPTLDIKPDVKLVSRPVSKPVSRKIRANVGMKIYPETTLNKMSLGRYVFDTFHTKNMRNGRIRSYLHLQAIDATGKRASFLDGYATYGKSIEKEIGKLDLQNTIAPVYCTITDGLGGKEFQIL